MDQGKVITNKLPRHVYKSLKNIVGSRWINEDRAMVETYSKLILDAVNIIRKHSKDPYTVPACVVIPENTEQVQSLSKFKS